MFGSQVLEVAIGLVFVYLLLSLLCSALNELIEAWLKNRAKNLEKGIRNLLSDPEQGGLTAAIYDHPLIKALYRDKKNLPSYIPSHTFALALLDVMAKRGPLGDLPTLRQAAAQLENRRVGQAVAVLIDDARGDINQVGRNLEQWYDATMERVAGWYKRRVQVLILVLGIIIAAALNADTITIAESLSHDPALREALVATAQEYAKQQAPAAKSDGQAGVRSPERKLEEIEAKIQALGLPIGWTLKTGDPRSWPRDTVTLGNKLLGLILTAFAISLGAPFWFDMLNKIIVFRSTVKPSGTTK